VKTAGPEVALALTVDIARNIMIWMKSYVLDTAVIVAALPSDTGASRELLEAARARNFELVLSVPLLLEYEAVLTRPEHAAEHRISTAGIAALVDELASSARRSSWEFAPGLSCGMRMMRWCWKQL
jgi:predicted nucleic acid-binding protein